MQAPRRFHPRPFFGACLETLSGQPGSELSAVISFLLQLGFHSGPAAFADLPLEERRIAADMAALGVLCPFKVPARSISASRYLWRPTLLHQTGATKQGGAPSNGMPGPSCWNKCNPRNSHLFHYALPCRDQTTGCT